MKNHARSLLACGILTAVVACGSLQAMQDQDQLPSAVTAEDATRLNGTDSTSTDSSKPKEPDVSFLSAEAQAILIQVKSLNDQIRAKSEAICAPNKTLRETIKTAIDAIIKDSSRTEEDKHKAVEAVFAQYKDQVEADRALMDTCFTDNAASLTVWRDLHKTLGEACLIRGAGQGPGHHGPGGPSHGHGGHGPGGKGGRGPAPVLTDAQKQEFETKLISASCSQAVTDTQEKLK